MQQELTEQLSSETYGMRDVGTNRGLQLAHSIISATPAKERAVIISKLENTDLRLARSLTAETSQADADSVETAPEHTQPLSVSFDRFVDLDRYSLIEVFTRLPVDVAVLALAGASQPCMADVLNRLPGDLSATLRNGLRNLGALRLSDIQSAQRAAVELSHQVFLQTSAGKSEQTLKLSA